VQRCRSQEDSKAGIQRQALGGQELKSYNLMGNKTPDLREETDDWWLSRGYASLSPQRIDLTDKLECDRLKDYWLNFKI